MNLKDNLSNIALTSIGQLLRDKLAHGGPDDQGFFVEEEVGIFLGHRRLSILDVTDAGHQPMEYKNWVIVFNGEIYNFNLIKLDLLDLGYSFQTESDTEVILKAIDCWGKDCVLRFRGMFAFAVWNKETKNLLLCRDRLGVKPLYYYVDEHHFLFASELDGITDFPDLDLEIDQTSVSLYLQVGYIKSPLTIYTKVKKLEPGSFLEIDRSGNIVKSSYWNLGELSYQSFPTGEQELLSKAEKLLLENCKLRMVSDVPVGVFLSGGIDSSLVTSILAKDLGYKVKTFSIGFSNSDFDESNHAKKVAEHLGTEHHELVLNESDFKAALDDFYDVYDEPFGDSSGIPTYLLSKFARKQVTVALSADGGDEIFGGYDRYLIASAVYTKIKFIPKWVRLISAKLILKINSNFIKKVIRLFIPSNTFSSLDWRIPKLVNLLSSNSFIDCYSKTLTTITDFQLKQLHKGTNAFTLQKEANWVNDNFLVSSLGKIDAASYLEGDILTKVDRATMSVALEGREPLLDHTLVEFGLSLPDQFKTRNGKNKWVLRSLLEQRLPKEIIDRPKKGFGVPIHSWMITYLKDSVIKMSEDKVFHQLFHLNGKVFQNIIKRYLLGKGFINPHFIWNLHMLYVWYQKKIKNA